MSLNSLFDYSIGDSPIIAVALHDGHELREEVAQLTALDDSERLREEDPFTGEWTGVVDNRIIVKTSRFEVDLNRSRDTSVYVAPEDAWGLNVWKTKPSEDFVQRSLVEYDLFYKELEKILSDMKRRFGKFVVFDLHSYNHRRNGSDAQPADPDANPEVNVGTGTMTDRTRWARIIDRFIQDLSGYNYCGRNLDVRENVKFYGRQLAQFAHEAFPDSACVLSVEFKKIFMDEWTGKPDREKINSISRGLQSTIPGILQELNKL